jgi:hypothetical protein
LEKQAGAALRSKEGNFLGRDNRKIFQEAKVRGEDFGRRIEAIWWRIFPQKT